MNAAKMNGPFQPLRGDTVGALELAVAHFGPRLRRASRVVARGDKDLAKDFYQIAITQLWELDPSRFDKDDEGYLWQAMMNRMLMARRDHEEGDPTRPPLALRFP